ncbi:Major facilitator superfamily domain, general substrate transporter [Colletotrichum karsti]|uniref:Major facilitator superfamily domain, general substrate transporter n=1 Tax=Colletotrichum karsti TaxID=1095194 RepID=A0A9P6IA65_9PEZI|nr:Major facilitator superfamily domain, general substrate transporter [Colletotrichum karsti]KAF9878810.1 Major facilitator superfamily domain, general substrate transporter [Colletotrichum karsti]
MGGSTNDVDTNINTGPGVAIAATPVLEDNNLRRDQYESKQNQLPLTEQDPEHKTTPYPRKSLSFKLAFSGLALVLFVFQLDATCLSIALPAISGDLRGTSLESFWANLAYSLCGLVMQPVSASISQAFGRKYPLYVSVAFFSVGSVVFATAKYMSTLIAGRVLQGIGGGGIDVMASVILADMTALEERSKYLGLMAIPSAVGNVMGPFVGALFSTYASWRWIGWINLPLLGVGTILLFFFLKLRAVPLGATLVSNLKRLDLVGMPLIVVGISIFCVPVSWAGSLFPWASWQTLVPLLLGVAMIAVFAWYESKPAAPIIPHRLFQSKTGNMALVGGFVHGMVLISLLQYLPLFYQAVQLETAISAAVCLLPTVIVSVVVAAVSMMMVPLFGGYVWLLRLSWVITALGTGLLALFTVDSPRSMLDGLPILWGQGVSLLRLMMLPAQASVKHADDEGLATANFLTIRMFGALVGLAICSPIFNTVFSTSISGATVDLAGPLAPLREASNAVNFIGELRTLEVPASTLNQVLQVYLESFKAIFYTMAALGGLGLVSSVFLEELELRRKDRGNQQFEDDPSDQKGLVP